MLFRALVALATKFVGAEQKKRPAPGGDAPAAMYSGFHGEGGA